MVKRRPMVNRLVNRLVNRPLAALCLLAVASGPAQAASLTVSPGVSMVGGEGRALLPGLRLGVEPTPAAAVELVGDVDPASGAWHGGLGLTGRWYFTGSPGEGLYGLGRVQAGFASRDGDNGPWTGLDVGFGARPLAWLDLHATVGPEWSQVDGGRLRTGLSVGLVFGGDGIGGKPGSGSVIHHPRKPPGR